MTRPYQHLRRAETEERLRANQAERERLQAIVDHIDTQVDAIDGTDIESLRRNIAFNSQSVASTQQITALLQDVQAFNFELLVRNSPELVATLGPGVD